MADREIVKFRKRHGLSRADLAGRLGVSVPTIWRWEEEKVRPHKVLYEKLRKIMRGYNSLKRAN